MYFFEKTSVFRRRRFSEKYKSSARKYQISDTPTSRGYARQAHHLPFALESLQLATYRSVAFVVTNSSLYVDLANGGSTYRDEFVTRKVTLAVVASCAYSETNRPRWTCRPCAMEFSPGWIWNLMTELRRRRFREVTFFRDVFLWCRTNANVCQIIRKG